MVIVTAITIPDIFAKTFEYKEIDDFCHNIGFMTNDLDDNLYWLQKDLEKLEIGSYECTMLGDVKHGGYKISFFKSPHDFHFIR